MSLRVREYSIPLIVAINFVTDAGTVSSVYRAHIGQNIVVSLLIVMLRLTAMLRSPTLVT